MEIIKMESISKLYKSGQIQVEALKDISFVIKEKEFVSIMGPSGSGKSTLLNVMDFIPTSLFSSKSITPIRKCRKLEICLLDLYFKIFICFPG